jgi:hypothetical protein
MHDLCTRDFDALDRRTKRIVTTQQTGIHMKNIQNSSSYLRENTVRLHYNEKLLLLHSALQPRLGFGLLNCR